MPTGGEPRQIKPGDLEILGAEEDPAEADKVKYDGDGEEARGGAVETAAEPRRQHTLDREAAAMQRAPDDELPGGAVPQAAEQHRQQQVAVGLEPAVAVAAQRLVQIVAQPGRQRDVPALP